MFHPRRDRTRRPWCVSTSARNPSSLTSKAQPKAVGRGPERASIGSGKRTAATYRERPARRSRFNAAALGKGLLPSSEGASWLHARAASASAGSS